MALARIAPSLLALALCWFLRRSSAFSQRFATHCHHFLHFALLLPTTYYTTYYYHLHTRHYHHCLSCAFVCLVAAALVPYAFLYLPLYGYLYLYLFVWQLSKIIACIFARRAGWKLDAGLKPSSLFFSPSIFACIFASFCIFHFLHLLHTPTFSFLCLLFAFLFFLPLF